MTYARHCNQLVYRLFSYIDYIKECPRSKVINLSEEIVKLKRQISEIETMNEKELEEEVSFYYEEIQSKL